MSESNNARMLDFAEQRLGQLIGDGTKAGLVSARTPHVKAVRVLIAREYIDSRDQAALAWAYRKFFNPAISGQEANESEEAGDD